MYTESSFMQLVGWTPLIELKRITEKDGINARIVGKIEFYQPLGSIKDRGALRYLSFFICVLFYHQKICKCDSFFILFIFNF
jgi:threonine dehydratase